MGWGSEKEFVCRKQLDAKNLQTTGLGNFFRQLPVNER